MNDKNESGFTLIELCGGMALVVLAGLIAIPQLSALSARWTLQGAAQSVTTLLNAARIQAMKRQTTVTVCASIERSQCGFFDNTSRYLLIVSDRDQSLVRSTQIPEGYTLQGVASRPYVRFQSSGWSSGTNMTLRLCDPQNIWRKDIVISNAGRIRSQNHSEPQQC